MKPKKKVVKRKSVKTFDPKKLKNIIPTYTISLKYGDKVYTKSSDDLTEAILALKPEKINSRTVFTLEYSGKTAEVMKTIFVVKRVLKNRLVATLLGRYLITRLR